MIYKNAKKNVVSLAIILSVLTVTVDVNAYANANAIETEPINANASANAKSPAALKASKESTESPALKESMASTESPDEQPIKIAAPVFQDTKFNAVLTNLTPKALEEAGFQLGDSCDLVFSNGYTLNDVPLYNGYYIMPNAPVIISNPAYVNVKITLNYSGLWEPSGLRAGDTVTISLRQAGKYRTIQELFYQSCSTNRADFATDEEFCNFREIPFNNMKPNQFYRGASPMDNTHGRALYTDKLLKAHNIKFDLDLADSENDLRDFQAESDFDSLYIASIYKKGNVALLSMNMNYTSDTFRQKLVAGLRQMLKTNATPVYIQCTKGKDRTGFVCMLLEALTGASYTEMQKDYMMTYSNYFGVTEEDTPEKYNAIVELYFDAFAFFLHPAENHAELINADYVADAEKYLRDGGMTDAEIQALRAFICNE